MKKCAILFSPHLDDELLIGGGFLYALAINPAWEVFIVFMTNGDYYKYEVNTRLHEAIEANKILGIDKDHIFFLGYGDQWRGNKHIYNTDCLMTSMAGMTHTYAAENKDEFFFKKFGKHKEYTRENLKDDILDILLDKKPDLCLSVDFDVHPDHRALSLLFEEAMGEVLRDNQYYHPIVLKKFAYEDVYNGTQDYYKVPHNRTKCLNGEISSNPYFKWHNRISFEVPHCCNTLFLSRNIIYKAAKKYVSQEFKTIIPRALNSDIVYWQRRTDNLALYAEITASSGEAKYINDFKIIDTKDVNEKSCKFDTGIWIPNIDDEIKSIKFVWNESIYIDTIVFYENSCSDSFIDIIKVKLDNQEFYFQDILHDGSGSVLNIEHIKTKKMIVTVEKYIGKNPGLSEIEVFRGKNDINQYVFPCNIISEKNKIYETNSVIEKYISLVAECIFNVNVFVIRLFPNLHYMKRKFKILRTIPMLLPWYWGIYILQRVKRKLYESNN